MIVKRVRICELQPDDTFIMLGRKYQVVVVADQIKYKDYNGDHCMYVSGKSMQYVDLFVPVEPIVIPLSTPEPTKRPIAEYGNEGHLNAIKKYS